MSPLDLMTAPRIKAARMLLSWTQAELAERAGIGESTGRFYEAGMQRSEKSAKKLLDTFEAAGVTFKVKGKELRIVMDLTVDVPELLERNTKGAG